MNRLIVALLTAILMAGAESLFTGKWDGKMNDLPGVDLIIRDAGGNVSGSIVFYFQSRGNDGKWHVGGKYTEPLLTPQTDGKVLTFEVRHHRFHGSPELGPNVKFRMELTGADDAVLQKLGDDTRPTPLKLSRRR
jgi:hypothetical protein